MTLRYPTLKRAVTVELADQMINTSGVSVDDKVEWRGAGQDVDLRRLDSALSEARSLLRAAAVGSDQEAFEGRLASLVHAELRDLPPEVLDDPGFWRYLALSRFWWFVEWREAGPISRGNVDTYVDGRQPSESIPVRLFIRGQAAFDGESYHRASALERSADFWRSHVLRVKVGSAPALTQALVDLQLDQRITTDEMRKLARLLNRSWSNIVLHLYDRESSQAFVTELLTRVRASDADDV